MSITKAEKQNLIENFKISENDTGSVEVQCAVLTHRINSLTEHCKVNRKDFHSRRGLLVLVGRRKKLLKYLQAVAHDRYTKLIQRLGLRK